MPCRRPRYLPAAISRSALRASVSAASRITVTTAWYRGPSFSRRSRQPVASSIGESLRARTRAASSRTGKKCVASSIIATSSVEGGVGLVAVRELGFAHPLASLQPTVQLPRDGLELIRGQVLPVSSPDDLGQRASVLGDLGRSGRSCSRVGLGDG